MNELGKTMQDSIGTDRKGLMNVRNYRETIGKIIFSNRSSCQEKMEQRSWLFRELQ